MKTLLKLSLLWLFAAGCGTTPLKVADATFTLADNAMKGWKVYVKSERTEIKKLETSALVLPVGPEQDALLSKAAERSRTLLNKEGKVAAAYDTYQIQANRLIGVAGDLSNPDASTQAKLTAIVEPLLNVIAELSTP